MQRRIEAREVGPFLTRAEELTFEMMRRYGITDRVGACGADVVVLVSELYQCLRAEYPQYPEAYVSIGLVMPPVRAGRPWTITFHARECGVELQREVICSA